LAVSFWKPLSDAPTDWCDALFDRPAGRARRHAPDLAVPRAVLRAGRRWGQQGDGGDPGRGQTREAGRHIAPPHPSGSAPEPAPLHWWPSVRKQGRPVRRSADALFRRTEKVPDATEIDDQGGALASRTKATGPPVVRRRSLCRGRPSE